MNIYENKKINCNVFGREMKKLIATYLDVK